MKTTRFPSSLYPVLRLRAISLAQQLFQCAIGEETSRTIFNDTEQGFEDVEVIPFRWRPLEGPRITFLVAIVFPDERMLHRALEDIFKTEILSWDVGLIIGDNGDVSTRQQYFLIGAIALVVVPYCVFVFKIVARGHFFCRRRGFLGLGEEGWTRRLGVIISLLIRRSAQSTTCITQFLIRQRFLGLTRHALICALLKRQIYKPSNQLRLQSPCLMQPLSP